MIETFKTMRGVNRVNRDEWFRIQVEEEQRPTRSNTVVVGQELERRREVIVGQRAKLEVRRNFFTVRVEKEWNSLPETVKMQRMHEEMDDFLLIGTDADSHNVDIGPPLASLDNSQNESSSSR